MAVVDLSAVAGPMAIRRGIVGAANVWDRLDLPDWCRVVLITAAANTLRVGTAQASGAAFVSATDHYISLAAAGLATRLPITTGKGRDGEPASGGTEGVPSVCVAGAAATAWEIILLASST